MSTSTLAPQVTILINLILIRYLSSGHGLIPCGTCFPQSLSWWLWEVQSRHQHGARSQHCQLGKGHEARWQQWFHHSVGWLGSLPPQDHFWECQDWENYRIHPQPHHHRLRTPGHPRNRVPISCEHQLWWVFKDLQRTLLPLWDCECGNHSWLRLIFCGRRYWNWICQARQQWLRQEGRLTQVRSRRRSEPAVCTQVFEYVQ